MPLAPPPPCTPHTFRRERLTPWRAGHGSATWRTAHALASGSATCTGCASTAIVATWPPCVRMTPFAGGTITTRLAVFGAQALQHERTSNMERKKKEVKRKKHDSWCIGCMRTRGSPIASPYSTTTAVVPAGTAIARTAGGGRRGAPSPPREQSSGGRSSGTARRGAPCCGRGTP